MKHFYILALSLALAASAHAKDIDVYFGTGNWGSKGIYSAEFDTNTGKLGPKARTAMMLPNEFNTVQPDSILTGADVLIVLTEHQ